jgi:hypothetical protein
MTPSSMMAVFQDADALTAAHFPAQEVYPSLIHGVLLAILSNLR